MSRHVIATASFCLLILLTIVTTSAAPVLGAEPPPSFAPAVQAVRRAVVSVVAPRAEREDDEEDVDTDEDADATRLLARLFGVLGESHRTLGAAVVIERSGIAVTSLRTLRGFPRVEVVTIDGVRLPATVAGRDERTDIAVLRIATSSPLEAAPLGDSDTVRVGDWVLAVGSPYGFEASVSAGIVSARARVRPGAEPDETFQTDAAINPGSVGGPLVNTRGDVIGILVIPGPSGVGVGFAVTSNVARRVVTDLVAHGHVMRGWLGITTQPLTPELAVAFGAPRETSGLLIVDVDGAGPAGRAGLGRGAILLAIDDHPVRNDGDVEAALDRVSPGARVTLHAWRSGRRDTVAAVVAAEPARVVSESSVVRRLGVVVEPLTAEAGVQVVAVVRSGSAATSGIQVGDLVREVGGHVVRTVVDVERMVAGLPAGRDVAVLLQRGKRAFFVVVAVGD